MSAGQKVIADALVRLSVLRGALVDEVTMAVYIDDLADLDAQLVSDACKELGKEPREAYAQTLPAAPDIRARVGELVRRRDAAAQTAKLLPMPKGVEDDPRAWVHCLRCHDEMSGFQTLWCYGARELLVATLPHHARDLTVSNCGRHETHGRHPYCERCVCWQRNPVVAKRKAAMTRATERRTA